MSASIFLLEDMYEEQEERNFQASSTKIDVHIGRTVKEEGRHAERMDTETPTSLTLPSFSGRKASGDAIGTHCSVCTFEGRQCVSPAKARAGRFKECQFVCVFVYVYVCVCVRACVHAYVCVLSHRRTHYCMA
jgi:hypothetical protein